jgi:hypothetical protein
MYPADKEDALRELESLAPAGTREQNDTRICCDDEKRYFTDESVQSRGDREMRVDKENNDWQDSDGTFSRINSQNMGLTRRSRFRTIDGVRRSHAFATIDLCPSMFTNADVQVTFQADWMRNIYLPTRGTVSVSEELEIDGATQNHAYFLLHEVGLEESSPVLRTTH